MTTKYPEYHRFACELDTARPDNTAFMYADLYTADLNLNLELPNHGVIFDIGCGYAKGTQELQNRFSQLNFYGITPNLPTRRQTGICIPMIEGTAEDLQEVIAESNLPNPDVILFRNVLQFAALCRAYPDLNVDNILEDILTEQYKTLQSQGKMLIYDDSIHGNFYTEYREIAEKLGFLVEELPSSPRRNYKNPLAQQSYLRLTKER